MTMIFNRPNNIKQKKQNKNLRLSFCFVFSNIFYLDNYIGTPISPLINFGNRVSRILVRFWVCSLIFL